MWNPAKGKSYRFGLVVVSNGRVSFVTDDDVVFDQPKDAITVSWPRLLAGGACRVLGPEGRWILSFGRPYPDAPAPDRTVIEAGMKTAEGLHEGLGGLGDLADLGSGVLSDLFALAVSVSDMKKGRQGGREFQQVMADAPPGP